MKRFRNNLIIVFILILITSTSYADSKLPSNKIRIYSSKRCSTCQSLLNDVDNLELIEVYNIEDKEYLDELTLLSQKYNSKISVPTLVMGDELITNRRDIIDTMKHIDQSVINEIPDINTKETINLNLGMNIGLILTAGIIDGINPCAISMLLFLFSILITLENKNILKIGFIYALGIWTIYFFIGLGLYKVIDLLIDITGFRLALYGLSIIILSIFLYKEIIDYTHIRRGDFHKIENELSKERKDKIHEKIKETVGGQKGLISIFVLGVLVGLLEFSCTGQVYLPTISYMSQYEPNKGIILLVIYNLLFVLPILIITIIVYKSKDIISTSMTMYQHRGKLILSTILLYIVLILYFIISIIKII